LFFELDMNPNIFDERGLTMTWRLSKMNEGMAKYIRHALRFPWMQVHFKSIGGTCLQASCMTRVGIDPQDSAFHVLVNDPRVDLNFRSSEHSLSAIEIAVKYQLEYQFKVLLADPEIELYRRGRKSVFKRCLQARWEFGVRLMAKSSKKRKMSDRSLLVECVLVESVWGLKILLDEGLDPNDGYPIMDAIMMGTLDSFKILLQHDDIKVNGELKDGHSEIISLLSDDDDDLLDALLDSGKLDLSFRPYGFYPLERLRGPIAKKIMLWSKGSESLKRQGANHMMKLESRKKLLDHKHVVHLQGKWFPSPNYDWMYDMERFRILLEERVRYATASDTQIQHYRKYKRLVMNAKIGAMQVYDFYERTREHCDCPHDKEEQGKKGVQTFVRHRLHDRNLWHIIFSFV
jgi:hypothetical protein